ncbi:hypothetical protein DFH28DRAFT_1105329 [Melampsora americana]|nr:hypothetical protein DFH28DRAFT_1105329 [Melampsora americana]
MKKSVLSAIIFSLVLYKFSIMVQSNLHDIFGTPHQLQEATGSELNSIINLFSEYHPTSNPIPNIADIQAHHEISTCLKDIENELMQDTDPNGLEDLKDDYGSDISEFWIQSLQGINTFITPDDTENHKSPKSKRRKSMMAVPQPFQVLGSSSRGDYQASNYQTSSDINHSDASVSDCDPKIPEEFHQKRKQYHKEKAIEVHQRNQSLRSQFQHSKNYLKHEKITQEGLSYPQFRALSVISFLKLKGALALWHNQKVSKQIDIFFNTLKVSPSLSLLSLSETPYSKDQVNLAIQKFRTDVVMAYFGGLSISFQGKISTIDLVASGWEYLQSCLDEAFHIGQDEILQANPLPRMMKACYLSKPLHILQYVLSIEHKSTIHPCLIEALIPKWEQQTIYELENVKTSEESFLSAIESEARLFGRKIWREKLEETEKRTPLMNKLVITIKSHKSELDMKNLIKKIQSNPARYLGEIGKIFLENCHDFLKEVDDFFLTLEFEMKRNLHRLKVLNVEDIQRIENQQIRIVNSNLIKKSINLVRLSIVPGFIGALALLNPSQEFDQFIKSLLLNTGLTTLKAYFSEWSKIWSEDTSSIILNHNIKSPHEVKWYDAKDSFDYFCQQNQRSKNPTDNVWFLYEIWYETWMQTRRSQGGELNFEPTPPHRDTTYEIISFFETRGLRY